MGAREGVDAVGLALGDVVGSETVGETVGKADGDSEGAQNIQKGPDRMLRVI